MDHRGRVSVVTAAASLPLSLAEAKAQLRVDEDDEDALIESMIKAAVLEIDSPRGWLGKSLITRTLRLTFDSTPPRIISLPGPPTTSISSVTYRDSDDEFVTIDADDYLYDLTGEPALLWPVDCWPSDIACGPDCFRVQYVSGYASAGAVPDNIKRWMLARVADMYRDRETFVLGVTPAPVPHLDRMLDNERVRA